MVGIVAKGLQDGLGDFADTWEMFQKFVPFPLLPPYCQHVD